MHRVWIHTSLCRLPKVKEWEYWTCGQIKLSTTSGGRARLVTIILTIWRWLNTFCAIIVVHAHCHPYRPNGSVFSIMYAVNTSGIQASVSMRSWMALLWRMTGWSRTSKTLRRPSRIFRRLFLTRNGMKYYTRFRLVSHFDLKLVYCKLIFFN